MLTIVVAMTWLASNLVHGRIGRMWMAVRDMDLAAELIGIRLLPTKLLAFAVSSFYCGVAGAMLVFFWYGGAEAAVFDVNQSFFILFMVIVGGLGSLTGSFFGAALIFILPIALRALVAGDRPAAAIRDRREPAIHHRRRADHLLPDRRAARPRAAVADWQAETQGVAFPVLSMRNYGQFAPDKARAARAGRKRPAGESAE